LFGEGGGYIKNFFTEVWGRQFHFLAVSGAFLYSRAADFA